MQKGGWVYIMTNRRGGALYIGVTSDLIARAASIVPVKRLALPGPIG